ncbi:ABC transporter permease [Arthrobacter ruber]|uniref:ABC transporter permease n=1 Tax=Arthrobacter ruber TaxID=1258893 RepID=UPI000CF46D44|nr:ABC transporter permease [Arthrobacter ruber]
MNSVLLKLTITGSRSAYGRLAGIAAGVAVGVCMLLLLWGGANGLNARDDRGAWLRETGTPSATYPTPPSAAADPDIDPDTDPAATSEAPTPIPLTTDAVLMRSNPVEVFRDQLINRRDFAALDTTTVSIPGVGAPPAPGEYYASPALQQLIDSTPRDELGDRYGTFAGTIDDSALPGPDSLVIVTGAPEAEIRNSGLNFLVTGFTTDPYGGNAATYTTVLSIGAIAVFFPVLLLISIVTGLGAAERRERFSTLRLIGASPRVVARIAAAETAIPSLIGAVAGVVLAVLLRPVAAQLPVNGTRMFISDLTTGWVAGLIVVTVVVAAAAVTAAYRTSRAGIGPLGVTQSAPETLPRTRRLLPLLGGLAALVLAALLSRTANDLSAQLQTPLLLGGFAFTLVGIIAAGPWLTLLVSRIGARRAHSAAAVIALTRIQRTPAATFRSVSGLVIAVFVVSVFAGASSVIETRPTPTATPGLPQPTSVTSTISTGTTTTDTTSMKDRLEQLPGIRHATIGYGAAAFTEIGAEREIYLRAEDAPSLGFTSIPTTDVVTLDMSFLDTWTTTPVPLLPTPTTTFDRFVPVVIMVDTDGTPGAVDRARTALNTSGITGTPGTTPTDLELQSSARLVQGLAVLAYLGMVIAVVIAGVSLAVGTASAILDRKKVLGLMRLMGMPTSTLRRIILQEAAVPLLTVLTLSIGLGFLVAWLMITGIDDSYTLTWPGTDYFIALVISLTLALAAVVATFGLIQRNTTPTTTRFA